MTQESTVVEKKTTETKTPDQGRSDFDDSQPIYQQLAHEVQNPQRNNRLCVSISDIHLTDGTVGFQNLSDDVWDNFFSKIADTCRSNEVVEVVLVIDGDFVDYIRSSRWAENQFYPWQREQSPETFAHIVNTITDDILRIHRYFFSLLKTFDQNIKEQCPTVEKTDTVILLGNHDKELMLVNDALEKFYQKGLGRSLESFNDKERAYIGQMYGDREMFLRDKSRVPYFPFYFADRGFRFFTTHGQWRDSENSRAIEPSGNLPGWKVKDGWKPEVWEQLHYRPFLEPCFGDSVAAGVLSTFIYKTKKDLEEKSIHVARLNSILDELDLYRPSYLAVKRILQEAKGMRKKGENLDAALIIETNLQNGINTWLNWDFTLQSASPKARTAIKAARIAFKLMRRLKLDIELGSILNILRLMAKVDEFTAKGETLHTMRKFPGFRPPYSNNGFQIHGEGHTHRPLQEEANIVQHISNVKQSSDTNLTYINFGTWRDQIVPRKNTGYRRRGVLRSFNILDLQPLKKSRQAPRRFVYFTQDYVIWRDALDRLHEKESAKEKVQVNV